VGATSNSNDVRVSAYQTPDATRLTVVLLNVSTGQRSLALDFGAVGATATVYLSSAGAFWQSVPLGAGNTLTLPSRSIATVVVE
jgi:glucuronoarabinoxylan endo-1,4-beta-xylanase